MSSISLKRFARPSDVTENDSVSSKCYSRGQSTKQYHPATTVAYGIMIGLLLIGIGVAIGHHWFYVHLNHLEVLQSGFSQTWIIRIGNAFAFFFKAALVSAITVAYAQGFWFYVRRKLIRIQSLDNMFGVLSNPFMFFNADLFWKTNSLFILAGVAWLLPISAVFAPGALTGS